MGGYGSGPYGAGLKTPKKTVEQYRSINIKQLKTIINSDIKELSFTISGVDKEQERILLIDWTNSNFGGKRPWFLCPWCTERRVKLYYKDQAFLCKNCHGLAYRRTQISGDCIAEIDWEIQKIQRRLEISNLEEYTAPLFKPKNMHQVTFFQLRMKLIDLKEKRAQEWINKAEKVLNII
ncbi:hypothetical protein [Virgibacillus litoralis]|uniref:Uncharacterized protein n=1 Tax=Virgibacillus litoralis TaxID=578221 RepID=A0ABS4HGU2_9BACI|nr:hypothetical protein [Virgibacillus litoralis]MBP1950048.1 hypothetical protein [Virgibacillus litoralis]